MQTGYRVCDVMTRKPIAVSLGTSVRECAALMKEKNVSSLVVKEGDMLRGHITDDVLIRNVLAEGLDVDRTTAADVMLVKVATIEPKKDVYDALMTMRDYETRQLPVVDRENGGKLVGLLTLKDVLKIQPQLFDLLVDKIVLREEEQKLTGSRWRLPLHKVLHQQEEVCFNAWVLAIRNVYKRFSPEVAVWLKVKEVFFRAFCKASR
ncbi:CBS domain-containing protein [Candidatus Woesearchaeota archaeon]|nr:CBS domain-containing protein [Candidatus Woesearchaeota archaeon]